MKKNKLALSITEAMVVLLVVTLWLVWAYSVLTRSFKVTTNLSNKITAIQIAREGIEALQNIRDTNWLLFPLNKKHCWITENYKDSCFVDEDWSKSYEYQIKDDMSYKIYKNESWRWFLESNDNEFTKWYLDQNYRDFYQVNMDENWLYTQSWGTSFLPTFTREIITNYENWIPDDSNTLDWWIKVTSIVRWMDNSTTFPNEVILETIMTNYKK